MKEPDYNLIRKIILDLCYKQPIRMTDLQKELNNKNLNISRGSLRHHLNVLEKQGKIEPMNRNETEQGRPTYIRVSEKYFSDYENNLNEIKELNLNVLKFINDNPNYPRKKIIEQFSKDGLISRIIIALHGLDNAGYIKNVDIITDAGKEFLKKNERH